MEKDANWLDQCTPNILTFDELDTKRIIKQILYYLYRRYNSL